MATVGVVTTVGCPYCKKAKAALKEKGVPYQEADLGSARDVLAKVKETTGQTTVPQVSLDSLSLPASHLLLLVPTVRDSPTRLRWEVPFPFTRVQSVRTQRKFIRRIVPEE